MEKRWTGRSWASPRARRGAAVLIRERPPGKPGREAVGDGAQGAYYVAEQARKRGQAAARRAEAQGAREPAAKRRKPRYEDDDEVFTAPPAPARTGGEGPRAATAARGACARPPTTRTSNLSTLTSPRPRPLHRRRHRQNGRGQAPQQKVQEGPAGRSAGVRVQVVAGHGRRRHPRRHRQDHESYEIKWSNDDSNRIAAGTFWRPSMGRRRGEQFEHAWMP